MPNVPGLTPINDEPSVTGRTPQGGRVVPRDNLPDPQQLHPEAAPTDTYARPASAPQSNGWMDLAQSLASIHEPLQRFMGEQQEEKRDELPGKIAAIQATSATPEEFQQRLAADPDTSSGIGQKLAAKQLGMSVAEQSVEAMKQTWMSGGFDKAGGDVDKFVQEQAVKDLQAHQSDPTFAAGYVPRLLQLKESLKADQTKYRSDLAINQQNNTVFGASLAIVNGMADTSQAPERAVGALMEQWRSNRDFLRMSPDAQAALQLSLARTLQDRIPNDPQRAGFLHQVVGGMLNADRVGVDGKSIGSLLNDPQFGGKAADLLTAANRQFQTQDMLASRDAITEVHELALSGEPGFKPALDKLIAAKRIDQSQYTSLTLQHDRAVEHARAVAAKEQAAESERQARANMTTAGLLAAQKGALGDTQAQTITNASGKPVVVSRDDQIKAVTEARMQQIDSWAAAHPDQQQAAMNARVQFFASNPVATNDTWKSNLTNAPRAATTAVMAGGPIPPALHDAYQLYRQLQSKAPLVAAAHTDDDSRNFFERARVAQDVQHLSEQQALSLATRAATDKSFANRENHIKPAEFDKLANSTFGSWVPFRTDVNDTANFDVARNDLYRAADNLVKGNGLSWENAVKIAGETIQKDYTVINGVAVKTADKRLPANFGDAANRYFDQWYAAHKEELDHQGFDRSHLSMAPVGNGNSWHIVLTPMMTDPDIPDASVSLGDMQRMDRELQAEQHEAELRDRAATVEDRQRRTYEAGMRLKAQVDAGHAMNIGGLSPRLMTRQTAQDELNSIMAMPDFAAGKALAEKEAASAKALTAQRERDYQAPATDPMGSAVGGSAAPEGPRADLTPFLAPGVGQDALSGLSSDIHDRLAEMLGSAPNDVRKELSIKSGFRSTEKQAALFARALAKYGSEAEARRWVAAPGHSQHNTGNAVDLGFASPKTQAWVHEHAAEYGLTFPLPHEPWHIEVAGARGR